MAGFDERWSRRAVLRGAGAMMALPFLESLPRVLGAASGEKAGTKPAAGDGSDGRPPLRMAIVTVTGGTVIESWRPKAEGALAGPLPSILRPLEPHRGDINILSGLAHGGRSEGLNAHEHCSLMHLTGADLVRKVDGKLISNVSIDQAAARVLGERSYLPSLEFGLAQGENRYSFRAPDAPVPYEANPRLVFERMFRGRRPVSPNWRRRAAEAGRDVRTSAKSDSPERSVVDLVREEAGDLRGKLAGADRRRLDQYLDAVRAVERRIDFVEARQRIEALDLKDPGPGRLRIPDNLPAEGLPIWKVTQPVHRDPERHAEYIRLMADLLVLALQTDTTRVATLAVGSDEASFPGVVTVGYERHCHTLEHQGNAGRVEDADPVAREACRQIHAFYTMLFAELVARMKAADEGDGSLLDNTLLLYTSYMADGGHGTRDYPCLLAGRAGGRLKTGRHLVYKTGTPVSNLYVEMLNLMGVPTSRFGESHSSKNAAHDGRLPGLV